MNCDDVQEQEIVEKYVTGRLSGGEAEAFEAHYFACERCCEELQTLQAVQSVLRRRTKAAHRPLQARWLAAAAMLLVVLGAAWWAHRTGSLRQAVRIARRESPVRVENARDEALALLARVDPPRYVRSVLRGDGQERFREAMRQYSLADYGAAAAGLQAVAEKYPQNSAAQFYLGVCYLMEDRNSEAAERLRKTVALGDSPELGHAHLYLAKALLRRHDTAGAEVELRQAIALDGEQRQEAQRLLERLGAVSSAR